MRAFGPDRSVRSAVSEHAPESVLDVFGDELSRQILALASERPVSVAALAERLDASKPTIYRRMDTLASRDLVEERIDPDREAGNHEKQFETTLQRATIEFEDGHVTVDCTPRHDLVDQFGAFWKGLEGSAPAVDVEFGDRSPEGHGGYDG